MACGKCGGARIPAPPPAYILTTPQVQTLDSDLETPVAPPVQPQTSLDEIIAWLRGFNPIWIVFVVATTVYAYTKKGS